MDDFKISFNNALQTLIDWAKEQVASDIPNNYVFIKCYDLDNHEWRGDAKYEYNCFLYGEKFKADHIIEDIYSFIRKGVFISRIFFTLYYTTAEETYILVSFYFSDAPVAIRFEIRWNLTPGCDKSEKPVINDYVDYMSQTCSS